MKKTTLTYILIILVVAGLTATACSASGNPANPAGTSWRLVSYGNPGNQNPAAAGIDTNLVFSPDGQVSGNLGCNGFSGQYEVRDGKIVFSALAATLMACPEAQMTQEGAAFQVLTGTADYVMEGNSLTIHEPSGVLVLLLSRIENK
jgi:heat shock protein HslJ